MEILGKQIVFSGGGYFRLAPYYLLHKWSREAAERQVCPVKGAPEKLRQYLKDFRFTDVRSAAEMIEWSKVPVVEL